MPAPPPHTQADIPCSYVLLSGLSYIMREVSKVGGVGGAVLLLLLLLEEVEVEVQCGIMLF